MNVLVVDRAVLEATFTAIRTCGGGRRECVAYWTGPAAAAGLVDVRTRVVTTVHDVQVQPAGTIPTVAHDMHVDLIVTPTHAIECPRRRDHRLPRLRWDELTDEKIDAIPLLGALRPATARSSKGRPA